MLEKRSSGSNTKYNSSLRGTTSTGPKITKKNFSVNMVSTRSGTESKTREDVGEKTGGAHNRNRPRDTRPERR